MSPLLRILATLAVSAPAFLTATVARADERAIVKSVRIEAPVAEVWTAWTTPAGLNSFLGIDSAIELRPGGKYEFYFGPPAAAPNRGGEGCTVLSYLPQRMLSFTWNAPPSFPAIRALGATTFVVLEFTSVGERATELRLTHLGWREGDDWDGVYAYFNQAWSMVLGALQKAKAPKPNAAKPTN
ncbi:MAG: SRPBCC domain-containing protein [Opitutus sp.]|nr:SRPBCC domain-containing protein [Opitutus sp.]